MKITPDIYKELKKLNKKICCVKSILAFNTFSDFPTEGKDGVGYIDKETNSLWYWDGTQYIELYSGGSGNHLVEITYNALKNLRDNNSLIPGMEYRITDYVTTTNTDETWYQSAENAFDIIVTADSANKLNENAKAIRHQGDTYFPNYVKFEAWEIKYCFDNDIARFSWADYDSGNGKGVIWWMKDEHGNECYYDFKSIQFLRYKIISVGYSMYNDFVGVYAGLYTNLISGIGSTIVYDNEDYSYHYTYDYDSNDASVFPSDLYSTKQVSNNKIDRKYVSIFIDGVPYLQLLLNNNVFLLDVGGFFPSVLGNSFNNLTNSTFCAGCDGNVFGINCNNLLFGYSINKNVFGNKVVENIFCGYVEDNTFGNYIMNNLFGSYIVGNTFGNGMYGNIFEDTILNNHFGNNTIYNYIGKGKGRDSSGNFWGTYLFYKDNIRGNESTMFNIDAALSEFTDLPRQVTIEQSGTVNKYLVINQIDGSNKEIVEVTIT